MNQLKKIFVNNDSSLVTVSAGNPISDPQAKWEYGTSEDLINLKFAVKDAEIDEKIDEQDELISGYDQRINLLQNNKADKSTILSGYGITDAYTKAEVNGLLSSRDTSINQIKNSKADKSTTLSGYGITNAYTKTEVNSLVSGYDSSINQLERNKADKSTTLSGYGITDAYTKAEVNGLVDSPHQNYITVDTYSALPQTGNADTIYRVSNYDGSTSQVDDTKYSEYAWNGSQYIFLCVKSQIGEVFDISEYNNNDTYTDLADALGNNGNNVPVSVRKGGMSIKYVHTGDNKYVQYRLMTKDFNISVRNWQGVNTTPIPDNENLVESGGIYKAIQNGTIFNRLKSLNWENDVEIDENFMLSPDYAKRTKPFIALNSGNVDIDENFYVSRLRQDISYKGLLTRGIIDVEIDHDNSMFVGFPMSIYYNNTFIVFYRWAPAHTTTYGDARNMYYKTSKDGINYSERKELSLPPSTQSGVFVDYRHIYPFEYNNRLFAIGWTQNTTTSASLSGYTYLVEFSLSNETVSVIPNTFKIFPSYNSTMDALDWSKQNWWETGWVSGGVGGSLLIHDGYLYIPKYGGGYVNGHDNCHMSMTRLLLTDDMEISQNTYSLYAVNNSVFCTENAAFYNKYKNCIMTGSLNERYQRLDFYYVRNNTYEFAFSVPSGHGGVTCIMLSDDLVMLMGRKGCSGSCCLYNMKDDTVYIDVIGSTATTWDSYYCSPICVGNTVYIYYYIESHAIKFSKFDLFTVINKNCYNGKTNIITGNANLVSGVEFNNDAMFLAPAGMVLKLTGDYSPSTAHYITYNDDTKINLSGRITAIFYGNYRREPTLIWRAVDKKNNRIFELEQIWRQDLSTSSNYVFDYTFKYGKNGTFTINTYRQDFNSSNLYYIDTNRGSQFIYPTTLSEIDNDNFDVIRTVTITTDSYNINDYDDGFSILNGGIDNIYICNDGVPTCGLARDYDGKCMISISSGNAVESTSYGGNTVSEQIAYYTRMNKIYTHLHR